jgi:predicted patatin/cPLA2 family phospholipase
VKDADLFVFLAFTKVGMYTGEEFEQAFGQFKSSQKPFIFTYFKTPPANTEDSLAQFKQKLSELKHFYSTFNDFSDLWNQFNKELERLEADGFTENKRPENFDTSSRIYTQTAEKIYNIDEIDTANFS